MDLHIKEVLHKYINEEAIGDVYYAQKIRLYIRDQMSASISSRISEVQFANGWLTLHVDSASLRHDLYLNKESIIVSINQYLDREVVRLLKLL